MNYIIYYILYELYVSHLARAADLLHCGLYINYLYIMIDDIMFSV